MWAVRLVNKGLHILLNWLGQLEVDWANRLAAA